jgi:hypothetical protein
MVDELGRRPSLGASRLASGMGEVWLESNETSVFEHSKRATAGDTPGTIASYANSGQLICWQQDISFLGSSLILLHIFDIQDNKRTIY